MKRLQQRVRWLEAEVEYLLKEKARIEVMIKDEARAVCIAWEAVKKSGLRNLSGPEHELWQLAQSIIALNKAIEER